MIPVENSKYTGNQAQDKETTDHISTSFICSSNMGKYSNGYLLAYLFQNFYRKTFSMISVLLNLHGQVAQRTMQITHFVEGKRK